MTAANHQSVTHKQCNVKRRHAGSYILHPNHSDPCLSVNLLFTFGLDAPALLLPGSKMPWPTLFKDCVVQDVLSSFAWQDPDIEGAISRHLQIFPEHFKDFTKLNDMLQHLCARKEPPSPKKTVIRAFLQRDHQWFQTFVTEVISELQFSFHVRPEIPSESSEGTELSRVLLVRGQWTSTAQGLSADHKYLLVDRIECFQEIQISDAGFTASMGHWFANLVATKRVMALHDAVRNRCELGQYVSALMALRAASSLAGSPTTWNYETMGFKLNAKEDLFDQVNEVSAS